MTWHVGRLVDHVHLVVADLEPSKRFYRAIFGVLGIAVQREDGDHMQADEFYMSTQRPEGGALSHIHLAFQAKDEAMVRRFYDAALAAGGRDNGPPGDRRYHPGYYAAFVLDPDGNNIEAVYHGPSSRSAPSVIIENG
jgi:catechol 2,3-dioxygenase-like lactoylglutathione lyase family enzyme